MMRCQHCGTPVGAGKPVAGDIISCADCSVGDEAQDITQQQAQRIVEKQMYESRRDKANGTWYRQKERC